MLHRRTPRRPDVTTIPQLDQNELSILQRLVTDLVTKQLGHATAGHVDMIARLQHLEQAAWTTGADRQTLQVITSGRRLLGDASDLTPDALKRRPVRKRPADRSYVLRHA
jgi:hypothetical protein